MVDQSVKNAVTALNQLHGVVGTQAAQMLIGYVLLPVTAQYLPFEWKKEHRFALHLYGPTGTYKTTVSNVVAQCEPSRYGADYLHSQRALIEIAQARVLLVLDDFQAKNGEWNLDITEILQIGSGYVLSNGQTSYNHSDVINVATMTKGVSSAALEALQIIPANDYARMRFAFAHYYGAQYQALGDLKAAIYGALAHRWPYSDKNHIRREAMVIGWRMWCTWADKVVAE